MAQIPGIPGARFWADVPPEQLHGALRIEAMQLAAKRAGAFHMLALSGGASDGAFGAGILAGLTAGGRRPHFTLVSGVSAGALIAPFAFLGPDFDDELTRAFTDGRAAALGEGGLLGLIFSQDSRRAALYDLVSSFAGEAMLARVAEDHRRGRRLVVITTNLDAQRTVVWDMGAIAASGHPNALKLFRDVLTASASVPGLFAPTLIEVEAGGRRFNELHVDGGATTQVFTIPEGVVAAGALPGPASSGVPRRLYIVINNRLAPDFEVVSASTAPVLARSLSSLVKTHARLTLLTTLEFARANGIGFNLTYIDDDFPKSMKPSFETAYMRAVYAYGFEKARSGSPWTNNLPFAAQPPSRMRLR